MKTRPILKRTLAHPDMQDHSLPNKSTRMDATNAFHHPLSSCHPFVCLWDDGSKHQQPRHGARFPLVSAGSCPCSQVTISGCSGSVTRPAKVMCSPVPFPSVPTRSTKKRRRHVPCVSSKRLRLGRFTGEAASGGPSCPRDRAGSRAWNAAPCCGGELRSFPRGERERGKCARRQRRERRFCAR